MRFTRFLKEDSVSAALSLDEPEVGRKYTTSGVKKKLEIINQAISELGKKEHTEAADAKMADLKDKQEKWSNVDSETKPAPTQDTRQDTAGEEPPPGEEEPAEEKPAPEEEEPEDEDPEKKKKRKKRKINL